MTPAAEAFAAVQDWQLGRATAAQATARILTAAGGDEAEARRLMDGATAAWVTVAESASKHYRGGLFGEDIGPAHGRRGEKARSAAWSMIPGIDAWGPGGPNEPKPEPEVFVPCVHATDLPVNTVRAGVEP